MIQYLYIAFEFIWKINPGARAGIRTRVSGMKTRDDGPGYTTRANIPAVSHLIHNRWPSKPSPSGMVLHRKTRLTRSFIVSWENGLDLFKFIVRPITLLPRNEN